jgi:ketosteroid isomerase-like protein
MARATVPSALVNTPTQNKQLVHFVFAELAEGNSQPFVANMADDVRWVITGQSGWSQTWEGKQAVVDGLFGLLRERIAGRIKIVPQQLIAEGDHVVVEAVGDNITRDGVSYDNAYCWVIRMAGGQIVELREYADTEFMTRALGAPLAA